MVQSALEIALSNGMPWVTGTHETMPPARNAMQIKNPKVTKSTSSILKHQQNMTTFIAGLVLAHWSCEVAVANRTQPHQYLVLVLLLEPED